MATASRIIISLLFLLFSLLCLRTILVQFRYAESSYLVLGAIGSIAVFLFAWLRVRWALWGFVALIPLVAGLQALRFWQLGPVLQFGFAILFLGWFLRRTLVDRKGLRPRTSVGVFVDCLSAAVFLSIIVSLSQHPAEVILGRIGYANLQGQGDPFYFLDAGQNLLQGLFFFRMLELELVEDNRFESASSVFYVHSAILLGFALATFVFSLQAGGLSRVPHLQLPFEDIHSYGSYAVLLFGFFATQFVFRPTLRRAALPLLLLVLIALSYSRSSWLVALLVICFLVFSTAKRAVIGVAFLMLTVTLVRVSSDWIEELDQPYLNRLATLASPENFLSDEKVLYRIVFWKSALRVFSNRPVTGAGVGSFYRHSGNFIEEIDLSHVPSTARSAPSFDNAHNYYLQLLAELGLTGLILFILIIGQACKNVLQTIRFSERGHRELKGLLVGLGCYLATLLSGHALIFSSHQLIFWFVIAVVALGGPRRDESSTQLTVAARDAVTEKESACAD